VGPVGKTGEDEEEEIPNEEEDNEIADDGMEHSVIVIAP
jgi:hypothetical protein